MQGAVVLGRCLAEAGEAMADVVTKPAFGNHDQEAATRRFSIRKM